MLKKKHCEDTIKYVPKGAKWLLKGVMSIQHPQSFNWHALGGAGTQWGCTWCFFLKPIMSQI